MLGGGGKKEGGTDLRGIGGGVDFLDHRFAIHSLGHELISAAKELLVQELLDGDVFLHLALFSGALERRIVIPDRVVCVVIIFAVFLFLEAESL